MPARARRRRVQLLASASGTGRWCGSLDHVEAKMGGFSDATVERDALGGRSCSSRRAREGRAEAARAGEARLVVLEAAVGVPVELLQLRAYLQ